MRRSFSSRNPVRVAVVGLLVLAVLGLLVFYSSSLPLVGAGTTYRAFFTEAAGLRTGNEVRIAGVKVGQVSGVALQDDVVEVDFQVKGAWVGDRSTAAIKIRTALGQKYLALDPLGTQPLDPSVAIPASRTTSPFDVQQALSGLTTTVEQIDTAQLAQSFDVLSDAFADTPASVRGALQGLTALSRTISSRDTQLATLLKNTRAITATLDERGPQVAALIQDGNLLLGELQQRREAITTLLRSTQSFAVQVRGLVTDNQAQLKPALDKLQAVAAVLDRHQADLGRALSLAAPYYAMLADATGNGRWLDGYICGLFDASGAPVLDATAQRTCKPETGASR